MSRLPIPSLEESPQASHSMLAAVGRQLGVVPNLFRLVGISPAALEGYLSLSGALNKALDAKTRERIALTVAQVNGCDYCLSAHTYLGANVAKLDAAEMAANRRGHSGEPKADAMIAFAKKVAESRGRVTEGDLSAVRMAGYTDAQIVEAVLVVALNFLTNMVNNVAETDIDFPAVHAMAA